MYYALTALTLITFLFFAVLAAGLPFTDAISSASGLAFEVVVSLLGLALLWALIEMFRWPVKQCYVGLSPHGIHHKTFAFEHFVPWHAVLDVAADDYRNGPRIAAKALPSEDTWVRRARWMSKQYEFKLLPFLVVRGRWLAVDPALLYHALRYYHAHPEARPELATEAGLRRIREGNLLDRPG